MNDPNQIIGKSKGLKIGENRQNGRKNGQKTKDGKHQDRLKSMEANPLILPFDQEKQQPGNAFEQIAKGAFQIRIDMETGFLSRFWRRIGHLRSVFFGEVSNQGELKPFALISFDHQYDPQNETTNSYRNEKEPENQSDEWNVT